MIFNRKSLSVEGNAGMVVRMLNDYLTMIAPKMGYGSGILTPLEKSNEKNVLHGFSVIIL